MSVLLFIVSPFPSSVPDCVGAQEILNEWMNKWMSSWQCLKHTRECNCKNLTVSDYTQ